MNAHDTQEKIIHNLEEVIKDAETLLHNNGEALSGEITNAKERIESTIKNAKEEIVRLEKLLVDKTKHAAKTTDHYVKQHPWQAVGIGAAIGLVVGLLISRK